MIRSRKGLTLIELIVVMGIITIMSTATVLSIRVLPYWRLSGASKELIGNLRKAQSSALKEQNIFKVSFNINNQTYSTYRIQSGSESLIETTQLDRISLSSLSPNIINNEIRFNSSGNTLNNSNNPLGVATVALTNTQGKIITVEISPSGSMKSY